MRIPKPDELKAIEKLLMESGLPTDDLSRQDLSLYRVIGPSDDLAAVGGLERFDDVALIRSIATAVAVRGRGVAGEIVRALEQLSIDKGFRHLYLLTESAEGYFESRGYTPVDRSVVPQSIRNSRQFSSLCPSSASVMCKSMAEVSSQ